MARPSVSESTLLIAVLGIIPATLSTLGLTMWGVAFPYSSVSAATGDFTVSWIVRPIAQFYAHGGAGEQIVTSLVAWLGIVWAIRGLRNFYIAHPALKITFEKHRPRQMV